MPATRHSQPLRGKRREVSEDTSFTGQASTPQVAAFRRFAQFVFSVCAILTTLPFNGSPGGRQHDVVEKKRPQRGGGLRPSFHRMAMGHGVRSSLPTDPRRVRSRRIDRFPTLRQPERGRQPRRPYFSELAVTSLACSSASNFRRTPRMLASLVSASRLLKMAIFSRCMKCSKCSMSNL